MDTGPVIDAHRRAGRDFAVDGVRSFVREQGDGDPVVCLHGVPASSFLYRKVLPELAARGLRGVAFDLPGLGLADGPRTSTTPGPGWAASPRRRWTRSGLDRFHLVVHDIGGPVGLRAGGGDARPRIRSLTLLNTLIEVDELRAAVVDGAVRAAAGSAGLAGHDDAAGRSGC